MMDDFARFNVKRYEKVLRDGTKLVLYQKLESPIYIRALFNSGSRFNPPGKEGLAHFLEHMVVAGSKAFPTKDKLAIYIESRGGEFGAYTGVDTLGINVTVAEASDLPYAITTLKEILLEGLFDPNTVETERGSILKEIGDNESNPFSYLHELWSSLIFKNYVSGRSVLGSRETVSSITHDELLDYYDCAFTPKRCVYVACGDISIDELESVFNNNLTLKEGAYPITESLPQKQTESSTAFKFYEGNQTHMILGFETVKAFDKDEIPLGVIGEIIGGGRAASLTRKLRYEKGLVYGVSAGFSGYTDAGDFGVKTSTDGKNLQEVVDVIAKELERVGSGNLTQEEVDFAKTRLVKSAKIRLQTSRSWVDFHAYGELLADGGIFRLNDWLDAVNKLTFDDINKVGVKYFKPGILKMALCGSIDPSKITINH